MNSKTLKAKILDKYKDEIYLLRQGGTVLVIKYNRDLLPGKLKWMRNDFLYQTPKEDILAYLKITEVNYPWDILAWLKSFYDVWSLLTEEYEVAMPSEDLSIFITLATPFPRGIKPGIIQAVVQEVSFYSLVNRLYTIRKKAEKKKVIEELMNNPEYVSRLVSGQPLPLRMTSLISKQRLYESAMKEAERYLCRAVRDFGLNSQLGEDILLFLSKKPEYYCYADLLFLNQSIDKLLGAPQ